MMEQQFKVIEGNLVLEGYRKTLKSTAERWEANGLITKKGMVSIFDRIKESAESLTCMRQLYETMTRVENRLF